MSKKDDKAPDSQLEKWAKIAKDPDEPYKRLKDRQNNQDQRFGINPRKGRNASINVKKQEEDLVGAIDDLRAIQRLAPTILKLTKRKISLEQAMRETAPEALLMLMKLAFSEGSDKVKADVLKHMLALAGHSPAQKHQIERVDPNTPKDSLIAMIAGASKDLEKEGFEVDDDRDDEEAED
jgi:hypothetical protein